MMKFPIILMVFGVLIFSIIPQVIALQYDFEKNNYMDFHPYTGNRNFVFNDTSIDYCITNNLQDSKFNDIAINAINTWHEKIVKVTNNSDMWDMTMHIYPKDTTICDEYVNYFSTPDYEPYQYLGVAGVSDSDTPVANVTVYTANYQKTLNDMQKDNPSVFDNMTSLQFQNIIKNQTHSILNDTMIQRITLHELGHSLGLNHPPNDDLFSAKGIMGYNMSYNEIDDDEVVNIVKVYPNGFTSMPKPVSINLEQSFETRVVNLGEVVNLTIEIPHKQNEFPVKNLGVYIFPDGRITKKEIAPIKIRNDGQNVLVADGGYIEQVHSTLVNFGDDNDILSLQFKAVREFTGASIIVAYEDEAGFKNQWSLNNILSVKKALFSDFLLDFDDSTNKIFTRGENPNRDLELKSLKDKSQQEEYHDELVQCLVHDNMKKCIK